MVDSKIPNSFVMCGNVFGCHLFPNRGFLNVVWGKLYDLAQKGCDLADKGFFHRDPLFSLGEASTFALWILFVSPGHTFQKGSGARSEFQGTSRQRVGLGAEFRIKPLGPTQTRALAPSSHLHLVRKLDMDQFKAGRSLDS